MKFCEIPQFTKTGRWECDYDMLSFVREIERMIKEERLLVIIKSLI